MGEGGKKGFRPRGNKKRRTLLVSPGEGGKLGDEKVRRGNAKGRIRGFGGTLKRKRNCSPMGEEIGQKY